jgi:hypothetical protein
MTDEQKSHYLHLGLLAVGAFVLIYILLKHSAAAQLASSTAPGDASAGQGLPQYPNPAPSAIQLGDINLPASPFNLTYNAGGPLMPPVVLGDRTDPNASGTDHGDCGCCGAGASAAFVTQMTVDQKVFDAGVANVQTFLQKRTA